MEYMDVFDLYVTGLEVYLELREPTSHRGPYISCFWTYNIGVSENGGGPNIAP